MKLFLILLLLFTSFQNKVKLNVLVKNIQVGRGSVRVEVYNTSETFLHKYLVGETLKASSQSLGFSFDLPEGVYAVAVYQDFNENQKLDKGWFGIPTEPYGLSDNFVPIIGAPTFNDCKFRLAGQTTISVTIK